MSMLDHLTVRQQVHIARMARIEEIVVVLANFNHGCHNQLSFEDVHHAWNRGTSFGDCDLHLIKYDEDLTALEGITATMRRLSN